MLAGSVWDALIVLCQTLDIQKGDVDQGQLFLDGLEAMDVDLSFCCVTR